MFEIIKMDELKQKVIEMSKCTICLEDAIEPQCCNNSHIVCFSCMTKLPFDTVNEQKCPTCRDVCEFRPDRNLKVLSDIMRVGCRTCPFKDCVVSYRPTHSKHHKTCPHRPFSCIHCLVYRRRNRYSTFDEICHHYAESHPNKRVDPPTGTHYNMDISKIIRHARTSRDCLLGQTFILRAVAPVLIGDVNRMKSVHASIGGLIVCESNKAGIHSFNFFSFAKIVPFRIIAELKLNDELYSVYNIKPRSLSRGYSDPTYTLLNSIKIPDTIYNERYTQMTINIRVDELMFIDQKVQPLLTNYSNRQPCRVGDEVCLITTNEGIVNGVVTNDKGGSASISTTTMNEINISDSYYNLFTIRPSRMDI